MHGFRHVGVIALGGVALAALTWTAAFGPPASVLLWLAAMPMPDQHRNLVAVLIAAGVGVLFCVWCLRAQGALPFGDAHVGRAGLAGDCVGRVADQWLGRRRATSGQSWLVVLVCADVTFIFALAGVWRRCQTYPSLVAAIAFRWLVLAWTVTFAFPWLGQ